jgi:ketosteroid isomerase-like protein
MSENTDLVSGAYEAFERGDIPAVLELLDDRVEWDVTKIVPQGGSWRGREGAAEFFEGIQRYWDELRVQAEQLHDDGSVVTAVGHAAGRLAGGKAAGYHFVHLFTFEGGKVVRFREWADPDEELRETIRVSR